jgi:alkaline phosphatase D
VIEDGFEPPYQTLGGGYDIFTTIAQAEPALMIWTGDTAHLRPSDWSSRSGYLKRFARARSIPQLKPLLARIPHYAIWSMHDYGAPHGGRHSATRRIAEDSFEAFWPRPLEIDRLDGLVTQFRYADVDFFMLDVRSYRNDTPDSSSRAVILGKEQIEWLRQALIQSTATFKVIIAGAPILNPADSRSNLSYAEREHNEFLQMLRDARISGLFFISGGKPYGELTRLVHANSYNLHDLTLGPLTASPGNNTDELNFFRMPGSSTFERHFALIEFTGSEETRALTIRVLSLEGKELWNRTVPVSELQSAN